MPVFVARAGLFLRGIPTQIDVLNRVVSVSAGADHVCATQVSGQPVCWGDNDFGQIGDDTLTDRFVGVNVSSFTANIVPDASLGASARTAMVKVLLNCETDARFLVDLVVEQDDATAHARRSGACTGGLSTYDVLVPMQGSRPFNAGPARATATIVVKDNGVVIDQQTWSRAIDLGQL